MENVPLSEAIRKLASQAHLNVILDPKLYPPFDRTMVSVRWTDVSAREALIALLANHNLVMIDTPRPAGLLSLPEDRRATKH